LIIHGLAQPCGGIVNIHPLFSHLKKPPTLFLLMTPRVSRDVSLCFIPSPAIVFIGFRVRPKAGRLKPFAPAVGAQMITSYRYWETEKGFETQLDTWTKLDNALLGFLAQPFRKYVQGRQDEFIGYINSNIALFGESIELNSIEFRDSDLILADPRIQRDFTRLYSKFP